MRKSVAASLAVGASLVSADVPRAGKYEFIFQGNISVPIKPGYTSLLPEVPGKLMITSFEATPFIGKSAVYAYSLSGCSGADCLQELPGTGAIDWPNSMTGLDESVFGFRGVVVGNGFLVPSHTTGGVWVMDSSPSQPHLSKPVKITQDKKDWKPDSGWFYHYAYPYDMDGDGKLDFVTARCQFGVWPWSQKQGELVWLQQPQENALSGEPWVEHHLVDGPDFLFCVHPKQQTLGLAATEFLGERTVYHYMKDGKLESRVIDDKSGPGFGCSWVDLNGDGRLELMATNHLNQNGSVFVYAFDGDDVATAKVTKHVVATGFNAATTKQGTASPGDAEAFHPSEDHQGKPYIFVSGDNSNSIFVLVPNSEDQDDWTYSKVGLGAIGADVGRPSIGDTDGDGFADVYVPAYDNNIIMRYKFGLSVPATVLV